MPDPIPLLNQPKPEEEQPQVPQVGMQLTPQGLLVGVMPAPVNLHIAPEMLDRLCEDWLAQRPALQEKLLSLTVQSKQAQLKLIKDIKRSKIN